ncbi:MAG: 23S rRNA (adenine(2503)-C(2))-methyltransferase RlmN [Gemmataceae bacterium]
MPSLDLLLVNGPPAVPAPRAVLEHTDQLTAWLAEGGEKPLRVKQIRRQILVNRAESFEAMTDLPKKLRDELTRDWSVFGTTIEQNLTATDGTRKLLLRLHDGRLIECVLLFEADRRTVCISTQVGCGMGCVFCASGLEGVARNLTASEIVEQIVRLRSLLPLEERLTHIVVMGMGEPLANLDNLLEALAIVSHKDALDISARHITISTVGLPAKIHKLAESGKAYHLAVSLHAPTDELRNQIVPTNDPIGLGPILEAADAFYAKTGRQVTYEYVLLGGLNDSRADARSLANLLRGRQAHVNLIPFNPVEGLPYHRPSDEAVDAFVAILRQAGISAKVRKTKGGQIDAACGQLRRRVESQSPAPSVAGEGARTGE